MLFMIAVISSCWLATPSPRRMTITPVLGHFDAGEGKLHGAAIVIRDVQVHSYGPV
jgi:hypothetical protein